MESRQEILVGLSISLTGRFSAQGRQAFDGLRLWQFYVNGQDGITIGQASIAAGSTWSAHPPPRVIICATFLASWQEKRLLCARSVSCTPLAAHSPPT